jgi:hypothetical protein
MDSQFAPKKRADFEGETSGVGDVPRFEVVENSFGRRFYGLAGSGIG